VNDLLRRAAQAIRTRLRRDSAYDDRMRREIEHFRNIENVHDLPGIFHVWSHNYVRTKMEDVFGVSTFDDFYIKYILRFAQENPGEVVEIASIGAGNGDMEVALGKLLRERGFAAFRFHCLDVNPDMLARGRELAAQAGLTEHYSFEETDVANWAVQRPLGMVIANQSLHHFVNLEPIFSNVKAAIGKRGYFLTNDMIGRNGHQRWPEALAEVERIWRTMPDRYKYNHQQKRFHQAFENVDYSGEGFEGIRAQDILPLLVKMFHFEGFIAFGNVVNVFVDRGFGHNFDTKNPEDVSFIQNLAALDEKLIDEGVVKPTQMTAVMRASAVSQPKYYRHWSAEFCVRDPREKARSIRNSA
jgi:SAM-dependent methyltransferase